MVKKYRKPIRVTKKRTWWKNKTLWIACASASALIAVFFGVVFFSFFQVRNINIEGTSLVSVESLKEKINALLPRNVAWMSTRSIVLVSVAAVKTRVLQEAPEIADLSLRRKLPNSLVVLVRERSPVAIWCRGDEQCFLLDKEGIAYKELEKNSVWLAQEPSLAILRETRETEQVVAGAKTIDPAFIAPLLKFANEIGAIASDGISGVSVVSFDFISQERVHARTKEGWDAYINPEERLEWQSTKLKAVLEKKIPPEKRRFLEYVDVRFGDQAYIKYKSKVKS